VSATEIAWWMEEDLCEHVVEASKEAFDEDSRDE
jgi:hypothetical protein